MPRPAPSRRPAPPPVAAGTTADDRPLPSATPEPAPVARSALVRAVSIAVLVVILAAVALVRVERHARVPPYWAK